MFGALSKPGDDRDELCGVRVLGSYDQLKDIVRKHRAQQVIIALPREDADQLEKLAKLHESGKVTDDEYTQLKAKIMAS